MNRTIKILLVGLVFLGSLSPSFAQIKVLVDIQKQFSNIEKVEVSGGALEVEYTGGEFAEVQVNAFLESNNYNQDIVFVSVGNVLKISHKVDQGNWGNNRTKGYIRITGPREMIVEMSGGSGSIKVENINSEVTRLSVSSGSIKAKMIQGDLLATASSGSITLEKIDGNISGKVSSGNAKILDVMGDVEYASSSGGISIKDVDGRVNLRLTSGNAQVEGVTNLGDVYLTSGNLKASKVGLSPNTRISGTSGNFTIQTYSNLQDYNFNMRASSGNITIGGSRGGKNMIINNGSAYEVKGSISSGNISITN
ncbi:DUF4097 domain-containing protein [Mongoliitalea daihaiensis]|uniref:DUF4097 domain-containing protein n=1 Tax=Mongoliitalea daihaiensis TaxID=2782006 RepID=UPI001F1AC6A2|nr:DUF4097 domain-containing protein [Mongoliitalea daihaiensis]UJP64663.1 DUF4097 family beta strand repeat protein [Mongoliitalea daihaiensis]